ncbi:DUF2182 domain-containing protein [Pseudomonas boanensis]|uniref:DUF2182 domain-containing protein n=1 Tax=Metapseudomonas boanensis TaxID=2822138 RepID=UPI0035D4CD94
MPANPTPAAIPRKYGRQSLLLISLLSALTVVAWLFLLDLAQRMAAPGGMLEMAMEGMPMPWTIRDAVLMFAMWSIMMVGMMVPSATPMFLLYQQTIRKRLPTDQRNLALLLFCSAYLLVWSGFSLLATLLQWLLDQQALLSMNMRSQSQWLATAFLLCAGLYQFVPAKRACLRHCQSPLQFLLGYWRPGPSGAWHMGLAHGLYCLGCCWALMGVLFVVGLMNLLWVALIGAYVLLEKYLPAGGWLSRMSGLLLVLWGLLVLHSS